MSPNRPICPTLMLLVPLLFACDDAGPITTACEPRDDYAANESVCCESYGIGSDGGYCCYDFEWTYAYDCEVGTDTDGGGRQIVVDSCCEDR